MATYWVYLNDAVAGPYAVEQLIRLRGFSRTTQVSREDGSGQPGAWMSPAEIPELARIFRSVDEMQDAPPPSRSLPAKPVTPRAAPRPTPRVAPAPAAPASRKIHPVWRWIFGATLIALVGAGLAAWQRQFQKETHQHERHAVQTLIETTTLPHGSRYATLRQCLQEHHIQPQWDFEPMGDSLYHATLSWFTEPSAGVPGSAVYAFEVNVPAQNIRGINTAAEKLLSQGFTDSDKKPTIRAAVRSATSFSSVLERRAQFIQSGDFDAVWSLFSQRKRSEMIQAGISQSGFVRLQALTHRLETGQTLATLKTKEETSTRRLVLLRQTQDKHPDVLLKQTWVMEGGQWKLDDEEKHASAMPDVAPAEAPAVEPAAAPATPAPKTTSKVNPSSESTSPAAPVVPATPDHPAIPVQSLPGLSN